MHGVYKSIPIYSKDWNLQNSKYEIISHKLHSFDGEDTEKRYQFKVCPNSCTADS